MWKRALGATTFTAFALGACFMAKTADRPAELEAPAQSQVQRFSVSITAKANRATPPHKPGADSNRFEGRQGVTIEAPADVEQDALSTFAIDVDTAAYSIARRTLVGGSMPEPSLVRVEEVVNYFRYDYDPPADEPFSIQVDGAVSPVDATKHLLRVGLQAKVIEDAERLPSNLVFLVDTSCSMTSEDRLALAQTSLKIALARLGARDKVAITTYAGGVTLVLPPTPADRRREIERAIDSLEPDGGTAMASGIELAYRQAAAMLRDGTNTRIIICSDGDANIGATSHEEILRSIAGYVSEGVRVSAIGFGDGNYKDEMMEQIADRGNGNYHYVDSERQAERVFGRDFTKMIQDVAQDVKIQVEFDQRAVRAYRLAGYENRAIADRDFRNDRVDAGEIGAGHQVTALYEVDLRPDARGTLATVRVRAKEPRGVEAKETERAVTVAQVQRPLTRAPADLKLAAAAMGGAELLRNSPHAGSWSYDRVISLLEDGADPRDPDRGELLALMRIARDLNGSESARISRR